MLCIEKARGKFILDEIVEAAKEWEEDIYALVIKVLDMGYEETADDYVELYRLSDLDKSGADWFQRGEEYYCSHCGGTAPLAHDHKHTVTTKFCPHCGYKMG
jgi:DNA-directed RNA polymerase subunit RPC12/RpoP